MGEIFKKNEVFLPDIYKTLFFVYLLTFSSDLGIPLLYYARKNFYAAFKIKGNGSHYQIIGSFLQSHIDRPIPTKVFS
jgi:hypothetical protein